MLYRLKASETTTIVNARSLANFHTSAAVRVCLGADVLDARAAVLPTSVLMAAALPISIGLSAEKRTAVREGTRPLVIPAVKPLLLPSVLPPVRPGVTERLLELVHDVNGIDNLLSLLAIVEHAALAA
jgi:hypothetical protein